MPINSTLLVSAAVLQNTLIDKNTGLPLSGGTVFLYQDQARQIFKNWYQQIGTYGNYSYIPLPNPLTLSAAGKITNDTGVPIIPFFYPYSEIDNTTPEPYYIQIFNSLSEEQDLIQNFPFNPQEPSPGNGVPTLKNYIDNSIFYGNIGSINVTTALSTRICLAGSAGFTYPDIQFFKDVGDGLDTITFQNIPAGQFLTSANPPNQIVTPVTALRIQSSAPGTSTVKYISIPLAAKIKSLELTICAFSIYALNGAGQPNNTISIAIYQFAGTGVTSAAPITVQTFTVTNSIQFMNFQTSILMPSASNVPLSQAGDDGLYLQIYYPSGAPFDITIALPLLYIGDNLGTAIPTNEYVSVSSVYPLIYAPRTGQTRVSVDPFIMPNEVMLDDGTIGATAPVVSGATNRANQDTWFLYKLLWDYYKSSATDMQTIWYPLFAPNAYGTVIAYGTSAYNDFIAGKQLQLPKVLGRVSGAIVPFNTKPFTVNFTVSTSILTLTTPINIPTGSPVYIIGTSVGAVPPAGLEFGVVYYTRWIANNQITLYYSPDTAYNATPSGLLTFSSNGTGTFAIASGYVPLKPFGEGRHQQTVAELAAHVHPPAGGGVFNAGTAGAHVSTGGTPVNLLNFTSTTGFAGSSYPFNVVQPTTFEYHFMHL